MTYTEVHANFCEQQITVRKVLVHSDTVDTRLEKVCPSLPTMSRSSSSDSWASPGRVLLDVYSAGLKCTPSHLSVEGEEAEMWVFGKTIVVIHYQMLEVVAIGNLILALP